LPAILQWRGAGNPVNFDARVEDGMISGRMIPANYLAGHQLVSPLSGSTSLEANVS
jgi:hypothetical protein